MNACMNIKFQLMHQDRYESTYSYLHTFIYTDTELNMNVNIFIFIYITSFY